MATTGVASVAAALAAYQAGRMNDMVDALELEPDDSAVLGQHPRVLAAVRTLAPANPWWAAILRCAATLEFSNSTCSWPNQAGRQWS